MIAFVEGTLAEVSIDGAVVDVGGLGYRLLMPASALRHLPAVGERVRLHAHLHVREDAMVLFGFASAEQRETFRVLLGVSGIGPKGALAVLGAYEPDAFRRAIAAEDLDALTLIPGVGKKTAARMVLELREKLGLPGADGIPGATPRRRTALAEVRGALLSLGYSAAEASAAVDALGAANGHDEPVEELLRRALKELAT